MQLIIPANVYDHTAEFEQMKAKIASLEENILNLVEMLTVLKDNQQELHTALTDTDYNLHRLKRDLEDHEFYKH